MSNEQHFRYIQRENKFNNKTREEMGQPLEKYGEFSGNEQFILL
jgi:hypothetical protein